VIKKKIRKGKAMSRMHTKKFSGKNSLKRTGIKKKVNKRASKRGSFSAFFKKKFSKIKKTIRREQRRCLRYKKYKNKESFCFVWAVLNKYFGITLLFVLIVGLGGFLFLKNDFQTIANKGLFGRNIQTNLLGDLTNKIRTLTAKIDDRKQCTEDKYWKPLPTEVCNYYLYQQENKHCAKFKVPTTRVAIGEKQCCRDNAVYKGDNKNKLVACPGADIFFKQYKMHDTKVVPTKDWCGLGACEFYPGNGFHAKLNEDGSIAYDEEGNIILEKDCKATQEVSPCSKPCGGGERIRTIQTKNCLKIKTPELCNPEPCVQETY
jgi:hypothetical protein